MDWGSSPGCLPSPARVAEGVQGRTWQGTGAAVSGAAFLACLLMPACAGARKGCPHAAARRRADTGWLEGLLVYRRQKPEKLKINIVF